MMATVQWYQPKVLREFLTGLNLPSIPQKSKSEKRGGSKAQESQNRWLSLAVPQAPRLQQNPTLKFTSLASDLLGHEEEASSGLAFIQSLQGWLERVLPHGGCTKVCHLGPHPWPRTAEYPWAPPSTLLQPPRVPSWKSSPGTTVLRPDLSTPVFLLSENGRESTDQGILCSWAPRLWVCHHLQGWLLYVTYRHHGLE